MLLTAGGRAASQVDPQLPPAEPLHYLLQLEMKDVPHLRVTATLPVDRDRTEMSIAPGFASAGDLGRAIGEVSAADQSGRALEVERADSDTWSVNTESAQELRFSYRILSTQDVIGDQPSSYYQAILLPDLFHATGHTALLYPGHYEFDQPRPFTVCWQGFEGAGWGAVSSFGTEPEATVHLRLTNFLSSLFLAGRIRLHATEVLGGEVTCALYGEAWGFDDAGFVELAIQVIEAEREFVEADSEPPYLISAIPVGQTPGSNLGGTGLTNSFALFLSPGWNLEPGGEGRRRIQSLLAHELFHHWNGHTIQLEQPEASAYWFSEGFTDYFARRIQMLAGLMDPAGYRASWNERLRSFHRNPARELPNRVIEEKFFRDRNVGDLAYQRGDLLALWLDHEIRSGSEGERGLDQVFLELLDHCRESGERMSCESLLQWLGREIPESAAQELRAVVLEGRLPPLPEGAFEGIAALEEVSLSVFELGFDFPSSSASGTLQGVIEGSAAHAAGLRDGLAVKGYSISWDRPEVPVELQVVEDGRTRAVRYLPQAAHTIRVPQLVPIE